MTSLPSTWIRTAVAVVTLLCPSIAAAQDPQSTRGPATVPGLGVEGVGTFGVSWPIATKTYEATGLDTKPTEIGGGVQVTNLWRALFAQVSVSRTSNSGERVFVTDDGTAFPLGIPLSVKATYIDASVGWKTGTAAVKPGAMATYLGGGVGVVRYRESSPFAESGDDLDTSPASYHALGGVEVGLWRWLAVSADLRYRWVPNLIGDGGASAAYGESDFGGFTAGVGLRVVWNGTRRAPVDRADAAEPAPGVAQEPEPSPRRTSESNSGVIIERAPVFLRMDASTEPLRVLEPGTTVKILGENEQWVRIEFYDRLLGPRVGHVQRQHIRLPKP